MEETYQEVIDAYNLSSEKKQGMSLTDYIKRNNIKIKDIDTTPEKKAYGGMMRKGYAIGSEEDIPEVEEMPSDEYMDLLKSIGADKEQASGIRSLENKMASEPNRKADADSIARELFGKGLDELDEVEEIQLQEYLDNLAAGKKAPSIKMAKTDPLLLREYEQYAYDMIEQGREPMPLQQFIDQILAEARMGVKSGGITSIM